MPEPGDDSALTREPQYHRLLELELAEGRTRLGLMTNQTWHDDPIRLVFTLSRYKFVARMLSGSGSVLEIGCADAFGTRIVQQNVESVLAIDFDPIFVEDVRERLDREHWPIECRVHDITQKPVSGQFDAIYALDVLEHIRPEDEDRVLTHICHSLKPNGVVIIGIPSLASQVHASPLSRAGHVNCKDGEALKAMGRRYFHNAFVFSMNDEVVHTGFYPMAHYLLLVCTGNKLSK